MQNWKSTVSKNVRLLQHDPDKVNREVIFYSLSILKVFLPLYIFILGHKSRHSLAILNTTGLMLKIILEPAKQNFGIKVSWLGTQTVKIFTKYHFLIIKIFMNMIKIVINVIIIIIIIIINMIKIPNDGDLSKWQLWIFTSSILHASSQDCLYTFAMHYHHLHMII